MSKQAFSLLIWTLILMLAQVLVFNHVCLFGCAVPFVFIYLLVKMPLSMSKDWMFTLAFLTGFVIDVFSDTPGMNALACTLGMALRRPVLRLYVPHDDELANPYPGIKTLGLFTFAKYTFTMSLVYCSLIFFIESFSINNLSLTLLRIAASTLLTTLLLIGIDSLTMQKSEKRL